MLEIIIGLLCLFTTAWAIGNYARALRMEERVRTEALRSFVGYLLNASIVVALLAISLSDGALDMHPNMGSVTLQSILLLILAFLSALQASSVRTLRRRFLREIL